MNWVATHTNGYVNLDVVECIQMVGPRQGEYIAVAYVGGREYIMQRGTERHILEFMKSCVSPTHGTQMLREAESKIARLSRELDEQFAKAKGYTYPKASP